MINIHNLKTYSLRNTKISIKKTLLITILLFLFGLMAFNYWNADYIIYEANYYRISRTGELDRFEPLFSGLMLLAGRIGLSYQGFLIIVSSLCIALLYKIISRYSYHPLLVSILYSIYPFVYDVVQIRNTMAYLIILYSCRYLEINSRKNVMKFILCLFIASSFHVSSYFYVVFLLVYLKDLKKIVKISLMSMAILFMLILLFPSLLPKILGSTGVVNSVYLEYDSSFLKMFGYMLIMVVTIVFIIMIYRTTYIKSTNYYKDEVLLYVIPTLAISIPLILLDPNFYRIFRTALLPIYIISTNSIYRINRKGYVGIFNFFLLIMSISVSLILFERQLSFSAPGYEELTHAIFESNYFIEFFLK